MRSTRGSAESPGDLVEGLRGGVEGLRETMWASSSDRGGEEEVVGEGRGPFEPLRPRGEIVPLPLDVRAILFSEERFNSLEEARGVVSLASSGSSEGRRLCVFFLVDMTGLEWSL